MTWITRTLIVGEAVPGVAGLAEAAWMQWTERVVHMLIKGATLIAIVNKTWTFHHLMIPHPPRMKAIPNNRDNNNNNSYSSNSNTINSNNKHTIGDLNPTTNVIWITISITVRIKHRHYSNNNIHTISSTNSKIWAPQAQ